VAIVAGVGNDEHDLSRAAVATLQSKSSLDGLHIAESRFELRRTPPSGAVDHSVPGPKISRDSKCHLGSQAKAISELCAQATHQFQLRRVANNAPVRVRPERHVKAERQADRDEASYAGWVARPRSIRLSSAGEMPVIALSSRSDRAARSRDCRKSAPMATSAARARRRATSALRSWGGILSV
jgi:hypothetical protein